MCLLLLSSSYTLSGLSMTFNSKGYLDAGLHPMDLNEIENVFVTPFPHSSTRKIIMEGFRRHTSDLVDIIKEYIQFLDGSFVSNKNDPGDIDLVCFINGDLIDALSPVDQEKIRELFSGPRTKSTHHCDAYFCVFYPETHPQYEFYRSKRKYWMGEFGYDRADTPKGIVVVEENANVVAPSTAPASNPSAVQ
jgi:hypothetical protein